MCPLDLPPFRASIKDGYACFVPEGDIFPKDLETELHVEGQITAGMRGDEFKIADGNSIVKIMTGAPIPEEMNAVLQVAGKLRFSCNLKRLHSDLSYVYGEDSDAITLHCMARVVSTDIGRY